MKFKSILNYIGLFLFFIFSLLGGLLKGNDFIISLPISMLLTFTTFFLVKLMINKKKQIHSKIFETITHWSIYILTMICGGILSLHFITIQFIASEDLILNGNEKLKSIENIIKEYSDEKERIQEELTQKVRNKVYEFLNASQSERNILKTTLVSEYKVDKGALEDRNLKRTYKQISRTAVRNNFTNKLEKKSDGLINRLQAYHLENASVFDNIQSNYLNINKVYYALDTLLSNSKQELETNFDEANYFNNDIDVFNNFSLPLTKVHLDNFSKLRKQYPPWNWKYLLLYFTLHILILFPLIFTRKLGKKPLSFEDDGTDIL